MQWVTTTQGYPLPCHGHMHYHMDLRHAMPRRIRRTLLMITCAHMSLDSTHHASFHHLRARSWPCTSHPGSRRQRDPRLPPSHANATAITTGRRSRVQKNTVHKLVQKSDVETSLLRVLSSVRPQGLRLQRTGNLLLSTQPIEPCKLLKSGFTTRMQQSATTREAQADPQLHFLGCACFGSWRPRSLWKIPRCWMLRSRDVKMPKS